MSSVTRDNATVQGGLVAQSQMTKQQQDAATAPPSEIAAQVAPAAPAPVVEKSFAHTLTASVMVTLDMTQPHLRMLKKSLIQVPDITGNSYNLYSPFRKVGKAKGNEVPPAEGVVRGALSSIFDITDKINDSKLMYLGKESEVGATLARSVKSMRTQLEQLLPFRPTTPLATLDAVAEDDDEAAEPETIDVDFQQIVRLTAWLTSPKTVGEIHEIETIAEHNSVVNITVNSGALYDATEQVKYINQVEVILRLMQSKRPESKTALLLGVLIDPATLATQEARDVLDTLIAVNGFSLYTRRELHGGNVANWLPASKTEVDQALLAPAGDMLLIQLLDNDEEEEADAGSAPAVAESA